MGFLRRYRREAILFIGTLLSSFGAMHFLAALYLWGLHFVFDTDRRIDAGPVLTCGAAVLLCSIFVWAFILLVRGRRYGWRALAAGFVLSAVFFVSDVSRGNFQNELPTSRIGNKSIASGIETRHHYLNWWWYKEIDEQPRATAQALRR